MRDRHFHHRQQQRDHDRHHQPEHSYGAGAYRRGMMATMHKNDMMTEAAAAIMPAEASWRQPQNT